MTSQTVRNRFVAGHAIFLAASCCLCILAALTLQVNPFPVDGWFNSQYKLFAFPSTGDNFSPTAAPALLFWCAQKLVELFSGDLEQQMYVTMLLQVALVWLGTVLVYLAGLQLGARWSSVAATLCMLLVVLSTYMTHAFWSEATMFALASLSVYLLVRAYAAVEQGAGSILKWTVLLGLITGLMTITRIVPVVTLAGLLLLLLGRLHPKQTLRYVSIAVAIVCAVVLLQCFANQARFGRFELSSSAHLHLYNSYHKINSEMLAGSDAYAHLLEQVPDAGGQPHWVLQRKMQRAGISYMDGEQTIRELNHYVLTRKFGAFLAYGMRKTRLFLAMPPQQYGRFPHEGAREQISPDRNPLGRYAYLPALVNGAEWFPRFIDQSNRWMDSYFQYFSAALVATIAWLFTWFALTTALAAQAAARWKPLALVTLWPLWYLAAIWLLAPERPFEPLVSIVVAVAVTATGGYRLLRPSVTAPTGTPSPLLILAALATIYLLSALVSSLLSLPLGRFQVPLLPWLGILAAVAMHLFSARAPHR